MDPPTVLVKVRDIDPPALRSSTPRWPVQAGSNSAGDDTGQRSAWLIGFRWRQDLVAPWGGRLACAPGRWAVQSLTYVCELTGIPKGESPPGACPSIDHGLHRPDRRACKERKGPAMTCAPASLCDAAIASVWPTRRAVFSRPWDVVRHRMRGARHRGAAPS